VSVDVGCGRKSFFVRGDELRYVTLFVIEGEE
jgi:hypothetical protein